MKPDSLSGHHFSIKSVTINLLHSDTGGQIFEKEFRTTILAVWFNVWSYLADSKLKQRVSISGLQTKDTIRTV